MKKLAMVLLLIVSLPLLGIGCQSCGWAKTDFKYGEWSRDYHQCESETKEWCLKYGSKVTPMQIHGDHTRMGMFGSSTYTVTPASRDCEPLFERREVRDNFLKKKGYQWICR